MAGSVLHYRSDCATFVAALLTVMLCAAPASAQPMAPEAKTPAAPSLPTIPTLPEAPPDFEGVPTWSEVPSTDSLIDLEIEAPPTGPWQRRPWIAPSNGRNRGRGNPLEQESWLNRPFSFSLFNGGIFADNPLDGRVQGGEGFFYGGRLGFDLGHFWGVDTRLASTKYGVRDSTSAPLGDSSLLLWDVNWMYYPWGDAQWRPFALVGMGVADFDFGDDVGTRVNQTTFEMPFGVGLKYRHDSRWVFRMDVIDNMCFASGGQVDAQHNLSLTAGVEARFGSGRGKSYWPWNASRGWH